MSWSVLDPRLREIATEVCTEKELIAIRLWANGSGYRAIGQYLDLAPTTVRDRIERGVRKINAHPDTEGLVIQR
jgi:DNA-binding CsgD family transcriptional regulator